MKYFCEHTWAFFCYHTHVAFQPSSSLEFSIVFLSVFLIFFSSDDKFPYVHIPDPQLSQQLATFVNNTCGSDLLFTFLDINSRAPCHSPVHAHKALMIARVRNFIEIFLNGNPTATVVEVMCEAGNDTELKRQCVLELMNLLYTQDDIEHKVCFCVAFGRGLSFFLPPCPPSLSSLSDFSCPLSSTSFFLYSCSSCCTEKAMVFSAVYFSSSFFFFYFTV